MSAQTLVVNFKNYQEILGAGSLTLAEAAEDVGLSTGVEVIVAPPEPFLGLLASKVGIPVYSQSVSASLGEKTTGALVPESVKAAGGSGTILNHSEARMSLADLASLVPRLRSLSLDACVCAATSREAARLSKLGSRFLAVEPPDLIGSGRAVSKARPRVITETVEAARKAGYRGRVLCGAGIVSGEDVARAVELGAEGVLVSSSVVRAKDWTAKLRELADSLH